MWRGNTRKPPGIETLRQISVIGGILVNNSQEMKE